MLRPSTVRFKIKTIEKKNCIIGVFKRFGACWRFFAYFSDFFANFSTFSYFQLHFSLFTHFFNALYNPQMPFKWNAIRVAPYVQPKQSAAPVRTSSGDNRRGDTRPSNRGSDSRDSRAGNDRKRESNRDSRSTSSRDTTRRSQEPRRDEKRDSSSHTKAANLHGGFNEMLYFLVTKVIWGSNKAVLGHFLAEKKYFKLFLVKKYILRLFGTFFSIFGNFKDIFRETTLHSNSHAAPTRS